MFIFGILCGLGAATAQAWSYVVSRRFVLEQQGGSLRLLGLGHLWMGLAASVALVVLWRTPDAGWAGIIGPLAIGLGCYLMAQSFFYWTVRYLPASRIGPLMGIKIAILACLVSGFGIETLGLWHWLAVFLTLIATWTVHKSGEPIPLKAWFGLLATVGSFAGSDIGIRLLIEAVSSERSIGGAAFSAALTYAVAGALGILLTGLHGFPKRAECSGSIIYAVAWGTGMICLYSAVALLDVVLAMMLQGMRGPIGVCFGALASRSEAHQRYEQDFNRGLLIRQLCAALFMALASGLYAAARWL